MRFKTLILILLSGFILGGCASVKEVAKGFIGVSTKALEDKRPEALKITMEMQFSDCYAAVKKLLKMHEAYIYAEDKKKNLIAMYISELDTTPVGIFFKEIDAGHTQLEISSPSTYGKEFVANYVFKGLTQKEYLNEPVKAKGENNAKETKSEIKKSLFK